MDRKREVQPRHSASQQIGVDGAARLRVILRALGASESFCSMALLSYGKAHLAELTAGEADWCVLAALTRYGFVAGSVVT